MKILYYYNLRNRLRTKNEDSTFYLKPPYYAVCTGWHGFDTVPKSSRVANLAHNEDKRIWYHATRSIVITDHACHSFLLLFLLFLLRYSDAGR